MKYQNGGLSVPVIMMIGFFSVILVLALAFFGMYVSASNTGNALEQQLKAELQNNKNILAQGQQKVLEVAQVPEMYRDDLMKVASAAIQGRYGEGGSKAMMQWLQEQNPNVDSKIYLKVQQVVESYRDEFKNGQTKMIDVKRVYETQLGTFWTGMFMRFAGYPKVDLNEFMPITTDRVEVTFKNGKEAAPLKLR